MSFEVAIIGAGLSGLTLALALHQQGIKSTIYEARSEPLNIGGAVMLSPNALKIMDALDIYQDVQAKGFEFEFLDFQTTDGQLVDTYEFGGKVKYGYKANRIYRYELIDILLSKINALGMPVKYGHKFSHVVKETNEEVVWQWVNGAMANASILVGADGIHSSVRKYLYPDLEPKFINMVGITSAVPTTAVSFPTGKLERPLTIMDKEKGAFVIAPQKANGSEVLIGKQKRMEEQTREGWKKVHADKEAAIEFLQENAEAFGPIAVSATRSIPPEKVNIWPFYVIPKLSKWTSDKARVVLLGDSAHAVPPSAGQGISQAYEDVYMFALLLAQSQLGKVKLEDALKFWQKYRQDRIDKVLELNHQIDQRRIPSNTKVEAIPEKFELSWLYEPDFKKDVEEWLARM